MTRPAGVTAGAVVAIIGSALTLLLAAGMFAAAFSATRQQVPGYRLLGSVMGSIAVLFSAAGIGTAIGLLRLRSWARISILVFAGFITVMSALMGGLSLTMPTRAAGVPPDFAASARWLLAAIYAVPFGIGVWWLIQFNTRATKAAFAGAARPGVPTETPPQESR